MSASDAQDRDSATKPTATDANVPDTLALKQEQVTQMGSTTVVETQLDEGHEQEVTGLCGDSDDGSQDSNKTVEEQFENIAIHVLCPELMKRRVVPGGPG